MFPCWPFVGKGLRHRPRRLGRARICQDARDRSVVSTVRPFRTVDIRANTERWIVGGHNGDVAFPLLGLVPGMSVSGHCQLGLCHSSRKGSTT